MTATRQLQRRGGACRSAIRILKRAMDLAAGALGLVAAAPVLIAIAIAIKVNSPGPVLFRQWRAGMIHGSDETKFDEFWCYKFRTMIHDSATRMVAVIAGDHDPRITSLGTLLRRTRLDELPQLFNVMLGEMSLVGPRPARLELIRNLALAIPFFEERMRLVKPGLTGLAQVHLSYSGRLLPKSRLARLKVTLTNPFKLAGTENSEADDLRTKMLYDFAYAASLEHFWSFLRTDLAIIFRTPWVMFFALTGR